MSEDTGTAGPPPDNPVERADRLREAIGGSAALARNLFLTFLLLGTYIAVTIGSTTDEQLLRVSPVTLPILDVDIPIVAFYVVVPWLLVLFHFNLLLQLHLLARQLHLFNAAVAAIDDASERTEQRVRLFPFPFVHMIAGASGSRLTRALFGVIVWVTIVWVPLALVVSAQVRFLPYHDPVLTGWGRLAVLVDVGLLWAFWPFIVYPGERPAAGWWRSALAAPKRWLSRLRALDPRRRRSRGTSAPAGTPLPGARGFAVLLITSVLALGFSLVVAVVPGEPVEGWVAAVLPAPGAEATPRRTPPGNRLTYWAFDGPEAPLHRNLQLADQLLLAKDPPPELLQDLTGSDDDRRFAALAKVSGVDLSGRDLRYASFHRAVLPRADLRGANLDGADLRRADLGQADLGPLEIEATGDCVDEAQQRELEKDRDIDMAGGDYVAPTPRVCVTALRHGARLSEARLSGASLNLALLDGVDLRHAELEGAELRGAILAGGRLDDARVSGAQLPRADLTDADLTRTILDGADLRRVKLSGAVLRGTRLRSAKVIAIESANMTVEEPDLTRAALGRADLRGAHIEEGAFASFHGCDLRGARLARGNFRGASFGSADMRRADLSGADLRGARFSEADLSGARLDGARLDLAAFIRMSACRAGFSDASLPGAHFENVALRGATLQGANLALASLIQVDAKATDLRGARLDGAEVYGLKADYADLRSLAGDPTQGARIPELASLARQLRAGDDSLTRRQRNAVAAAEKGEPLRDALHRVAAFSAKAPMLCDSTTSVLVGPKLERCMTQASLREYADVVTAAACGDTDVMAGIVHRLQAPPPLRHDRAGDVVGAPPVEEYTRLLASRIAKEGCDALGTLDQRQRELVIAILQRSELPVPGVLEGPPPDEAQLPEPPACEYRR